MSESLIGRKVWILYRYGITTGIVSAQSSLFTKMIKADGWHSPEEWICESEYALTAEAAIEMAKDAIWHLKYDIQGVLQTEADEQALNAASAATPTQDTGAE